MLKAKDIMSTEVISLDPEDSIAVAVQRLLDHQVSSLPVIDRAGRLVGVVSELDFLDLVWDFDRTNSEVYQYMTRQVHSVEEDDDLLSVVERFRLFGIRRLPVVRGNRVVGIIDRHDLLARLSATETLGLGRQPSGRSQGGELAIAGTAVSSASEAVAAA
ncbi:MAG: CBS domain-containing protein [Pirellulales bacterium]|nr:CBS domain-containing protein [Pirellulales bacterium]